MTNGVAITSQPNVISQYYDPQVEFLELGVTVAGKTTWKICGPDLNGVYGGLNGTGGFDAIVPGPDFFCPTLNDARGNLHAVFDVTHSTLTWNASRPTGYGSVPGYAPAPLGFGGNLVAASAWRGRWMDITGRINLGSRPYRPETGSFESFDPAWNGGDPNGYSFAGGEPILGFDPSGRLSKQLGNWASQKLDNAVATYTGLVNPETRSQTLVDSAYGDARGTFNWSVENAQGINHLLNGPLLGYFNNQALDYISRQGNGSINDFGTISGADPDSAAAQNMDSLSRGVLTVASLLIGPGEAKVASEAERLLPGMTAEQAAQQNIVNLLKLRERQLLLGDDPARGFLQAEGTAGVRLEQALGRTINRGTDAAVDFVDSQLGTISLKGPIPAQGSVEGLGAAVIRDAMGGNTATRTVVVDTLGLSQEEVSALKAAIEAGTQGTSKEIIYLP